MENEEWATGPPGLRTAGRPGRRAVAGRGPLGRGGPWAVGRGPAFSKTRRGAVLTITKIFGGEKQ